VSHTLVVDASALASVVAAPAPKRELVRRLSTIDGVAPELMDAEVLDAIRKFVLRGALNAAEGEAAVRRAREAPIARVPHRPLLARVWELRSTVAVYDAFYVALAEQLDVPLVTCDKKLAGASGHNVQIELYPPA